MNKSEFSKLAEDLETLAKAQGEMSEEEKVAAAAAAAGVDTKGAEHKEPDGDEEPGAAGDGDGDEMPPTDGDEDEDEEDEDEENVLGKSFDVTTDGGEKVKAYDATALIKSLNDRMESIEGSFAENEEDRESIAKSLTSISELLKSNAKEIETLKKSLADMGDQGRGRKAVLTVLEKPAAGDTLAKGGMPEGAMNRKEFMAKADEAMKAGRISGGQLSLAETYLNRGAAVPEEIVSRVMGNQ